MALRIGLDTNRYVDLCKGLPETAELVAIADIWIAALVLEHNLALHARDRHFDHLPQIVRA